MSRIKAIGVIAVLLCLSLTAQLHAQETVTATEKAQPSPKKKQLDIATLEQMSIDAYEAKKYVSYYGANIRLMNQRPYEPIYMQRVIAACALIERFNTAYHYMMKMQQQGLSYDLTDDPDTANIRSPELFGYLNDLMIEAGQPAGVAETVVTLDDDVADPSTLTWDSSRERFLVGTLSKGAILSLSADGKQEVLIQANDKNGLWAIKGLHADTANNRLWVSSAATEAFSAFQPTDRGRGALFEFDLKTLELVNRFNLPVDGMDHELGPIAVSAAGDVYIVDLVANVVFRKVAGGKALEQFVGSTEMDSLQQIAISPDNTRLYIADRYKGILVVGPVDQSSAMLTGPETLNLGRISGLALNKGSLLMVQSGLQPERVMQLDLDASGGNVVAAVPLASAMETFDNPGEAIFNDGHVYYFANLGDADSEPAKQAVVIARTPLSLPADRPEMKLPELQPQG